MNMSWVYESLRESGMELEFLSEDTRIEVELYIEKRMAQYMVWRVFHHKMDEEVKVEDYDCDGSGDVWGFVSDQVLEYHRKCPRAFQINYSCEECCEFGELNDENLCEDCAKKEGITVSITFGDGQKSLEQAKEAIAKLEAVLEKQVASNSSASVTPIAPFVTPRQMKEQMHAACEEAKGKEEEESFEDWAKTTIVTGIVCSLCKNELPPMTAQEHLDGKFNQTCPHK